MIKLSNWLISSLEISKSKDILFLIFISVIDLGITATSFKRAHFNKTLANGLSKLNKYLN